MIRRNPDLIALGILTVFLCLLPAVASRALPENKLRLIQERVRVMDEDLSRRIEERINDKIQEKLERFRIVR